MPQLDVDAIGAVSIVKEPMLTPHQFPRGASSETSLHSLFGNPDFTQPVDSNRAQEKLELGGLESQWEPVLIKWITAILQAPLNETGVSLGRPFGRDKQVEVEFYLPVSEPLIASQLDAPIRQFGPLSVGYPPLEFMQVRGMLKGFINLVFRHEGRYYLPDYESNWLGEDSSAYTQQTMAAAMQVHRYDLQCQFYTLVLHRYLRYRTADYDYDRRLGGVIYLFLHGVDKEHPQQEVYIARPNVGLIALMDKMFAGMILEGA